MASAMDMPFSSSSPTSLKISSTSSRSPPKPAPRPPSPPRPSAPPPTMLGDVPLLAPPAAPLLLALASAMGPRVLCRCVCTTSSRCLVMKLESVTRRKLSTGKASLVALFALKITSTYLPTLRGGKGWEGKGSGVWRVGGGGGGW